MNKKDLDMNVCIFISNSIDEALSDDDFWMVLNGFSEEDKKYFITKVKSTSLRYDNKAIRMFNEKHEK